MLKFLLDLNEFDVKLILKSVVARWLANDWKYKLTYGHKYKSIETQLDLNFNL